MPKPTSRAAVAAFQLMLVQLLEALEITDLENLTVNVNGRAQRLDIARLSADGSRVGEWLCAFSLDPHNLTTFGTPVGLPGMDSQDGRAH